MITVETDKYYLFPSSIYVSDHGHMVDTILGSCVAVCLFDSRLKIGGINHYMLPYWNGEGLASPKYGNIANEKLLEKLIRLGSNKRDLVAKLFGGANQINSSINVGDRNVLVAREQLSALGIRIVSENVGGNTGRKIRFNTGTNEVLMRFLSKKE